jgi:hypothetical protein
MMYALRIHRVLKTTIRKNVCSEHLRATELVSDITNPSLVLLLFEILVNEPSGAEEYHLLAA